MLPMRIPVVMLPALVLAASAADSKVCAECHASIARAYSMTAMAQTSGATGSGTFQEQFQHNEVTTAGGGFLQVGPTVSGLAFTFRDGIVEGNRGLHYFIGSGIVGRSYATSIDGFLFQAPVSYYTAPARWGLSPGFESNPSIHLTREVEPSCLKCHATGVQALPGSSNGYADKPFLEAGIGCERCHGPGDDHVRSMRAGKPGLGAKIVNPAKLGQQQRDSVCAQCHLPGAVEIARAGKRAAYQPGARLSDSVVVFALAGVDREATVNGHAEQLNRSACLRQSKGRLWCGTCHEVHRAEPVGERAAYYRGKCMQCHEQKPCVVSKGGDCVACHMPKQSAATVAHAAVTQHDIARVPKTPAALPANLELMPYAGFVATSRDLGLAYATIAIRDNNRAWGMRAFELLRGLPEDDTKAAAKLAQLYDRMGRGSEACAMYARIYAQDPTAAVTVNLGACRAAEGKMEEAIRLWNAAVRLSPAMEAGRLNLAVAQYRGGDVEAAKKTLQDGLRVNPLSPKIREILAGME